MPKKGYKQTPEHRAKISAANAGKKRGPLSEEHKAKISVAVSAAMTAEVRTNISDTTRGKPKSPEHRANIAAAQANPEHRARMSASSTALWADPGYRSMMEELFSGPEYRAKLSEIQTEIHSNPEFLAKQSAAHTELWADPEYRAMMEEAFADPEYRAKLSARTTTLWTDPGYRARMVAAFEAGPEWLGPFIARGEMVLTLLEQDGDLCQLCLTPLFLDVHYTDLLYTNIDHIRPRESGGTDDPQNLWLAHGTCNWSKGSRFVGRPDGTTDRKAVK